MSEELLDLVIVGCGPAGLSAAINAKIRKQNFIIFGLDFCSPKLSWAPTIDNYLGFFKIKGEDLRQKFLKHVEDMEIEITSQRVDKILKIDKYFMLQCDQKNYFAKAVIVATGIESGKKITGEKDFIGRGVSYCVTCDGPLYNDKVCAMITYSSEGEEELKFLADICSKIYYLPQHEKVLESVSENVERINARPKEIKGGKMVEKLILEDGKELSVDGIFIYRPNLPPDQLVPGVETESKALKVNRNLETNIEGLFAAGDCTGAPYQLGKAVGEGQTAALNAVKYIAKH